MAERKKKNSGQELQQPVRGILMAGVGGQGILRASDILSHAFMASGLDVKKSEVHGMAQRGGCVTSHVRYGAKVYSPIDRRGNVDILLAFERLEALRYLDYLKRDAKVVINDLALNPPAVNLGEMAYPKDILSFFTATFPEVKIVKAFELARQAGNARAENTVLLGTLSRWLDIEIPVWERVIKEAFPPQAAEVNLRAFHLGREA
ncbi:MAG TPA: indolepyruvate oxidoreductase subunit beta [Syntrophales bacterium]|nr:indolepyruvate oxidoreductase subunit beta [Syntrophales bacterium]HOM07063.1 indolepyruvate oxidoreductase subunit beta [Syntrophales bacterium]HON98900.1 indolepyruvate oxidoreductase subunit beta [Syntrophales bacterium]HPC00364.1 indolepyruvate oxidoreductase subunit beta [Syntrophales bacterium]HPQ06568.1 indolepyruvate oxidoreductase subunit beta [Syntrophales bacterium]